MLVEVLVGVFVSAVRGYVDGGSGVRRLVCKLVSVRHAGVGGRGEEVTGAVQTRVRVLPPVRQHCR